MAATIWTLLFTAALVASLVARTWLTTRQCRHVARHRDQVPAPFRASIALAAHQKAADYTLAKARFGTLQMAFGAVVLLGWTLFGGLDLLNGALRDAIVPHWGGLAYEVALVVAFVAIGGVLELPFELYATFGLEARFGFNRIGWRLWVADTLKSTALSIAIGVPLLALVLWIMAAAGPRWWLYAWAVWVAFNLVAFVFGPTVIAPLFNRFSRIEDDTLTARVQALMGRAGLALRGLFVMDGSRRSAHANAYFTGFGHAKRVVFFDTLLARLTPGEVEAVLAHELGHHARRHLTQRICWSFAGSLLIFATLGVLSTRLWFYTGLGVLPSLTAPNDALALLLLLVLAAPVFAFFVTPFFTRMSRKHEFEADAYACAQASGSDLASALLKLHEDNASTLTPDPVFARFYYSHPPAAERLAALSAAIA